MSHTIFSQFKKRPHDLLEMHREGKLLYPDFRREYSWNKKRILDFIETMYRGIVMPSALVLFEELAPLDPASRKRIPNGNGICHLVDGMQRFETLKRIAEDTLEIMFCPSDERFQFANVRNRNNRFWIPISKIVKMKVSEVPQIAALNPVSRELDRAMLQAKYIFDYEFPCIHILGYDYELAEQTFMSCNRLNVKRYVNFDSMK